MIKTMAVCDGPDCPKAVPVTREMYPEGWTVLHVQLRGQHPGTQAEVSFCSQICLVHWAEMDLGMSA